MTEQEWLQEGMDFRLFFLRFIRKLRLVIAAGIAGALLFGGIYFIRHVIYAPARQYEAVSRYYITFADDRGKDYYNDYTWNDLAASDPILDYTMSLLPQGYDKEQVRRSVEAKIPSDVRVMTTTVTTQAAEQTQEIALATERSILRFGEIMPEIAKIEVIMDAEVKPVIVDVHTVKTTLLGLAAGLLCGIFAVLFRLILDTSVYLDTEAARRFGVAVLGSFYKGELAGMQKLASMQKLAGMKDAKPAESDGMPLHHREMAENLIRLAAGEQKLAPLFSQEKQAADKAAARMNIIIEAAKAGKSEKPSGQKSAGSITASDSCLEQPEIYESLRGADGVILLVRCGADNAGLIRKEMEQLRQQGCRISGIVLYEADRKLTRWYYFGSKREGLKVERNE